MPTAGSGLAVLPDVSPAPTAIGESPARIAWRKLQQNPSAMFGLIVIALATMVALLAYPLAPDDTPDANTATVALQKQLPGFRVTMARVRLADAAWQPLVGWLGYVLGGRPRQWREVPTAQLIVVGRDSVRLDPPASLGLPPGAGEVVLRSAVAGLPEQTTSPSAALYPKTFSLGTDGAGRDELSRLLLGTRISLGIGLVAALLALVLGASVGALAGYAGGWIDRLARFVMTVVWSVPGVMLVVAIAMAVGSKGAWVTFVAVGLTMWVDVARVVRGQVLALRERPFVEALRGLGLGPARIIAFHLLPNLLGPLVVVTTANFAAAILLEAGLSFLGLGVQPPAPSWGTMVSEGFLLLGTRAGLWLTLLPSAAISLLVLAFNLLGNGLRDAFDPATPLRRRAT